MGGYLKEIIPLGVDKNKTGVLKARSMISVLFTCRALFFGSGCRAGFSTKQPLADGYSQIRVRLRYSPAIFAA